MMTRMHSCRNRFLWIVVVLLAISGCFQLSTVSSLSARPPKSNSHPGIDDRSIIAPLPRQAGVSRRDWLVAGACSGLLWNSNPASASQPKLAPEYFNPSNVVTDPSAGRSYFPALTPPFFDRATYKYTLGRNTWALEQLLTFANVTATIKTTVVKLQSTGGLWVHSPQWPTGEFCSLLESMGGPVEHVVLPCNAFEHKAPLQAFVERYPNAQVWIAPGQYGPLGSCGTTMSGGNKPQMGYRVDGILGDATSPPPPWSDEFDIATLYIDLPRNAGPVSEVAFCHRPTKTLVTTDAVVYVPETPSGILETYFDTETLESPNFWPRSVLQAVFLPLREQDERYAGYEALVNRLARAPILRAVVDARAPNAVRDWILEQTTTTTKATDGTKHWDYDRVVTSHFASPIEATPSDVRASFEYLFTEDLGSNKNLPPIACQDWELLDSINQFIAKYNAGEPAIFDFQRGCVAE